VTKKEMGMAILAGVLNPTKRTAAVKIGTTAKMLLSMVTYSVGYCFILVGTMSIGKKTNGQPTCHHNPARSRFLLSWATFSIVSLWTFSSFEG